MKRLFTFLLILTPLLITSCYTQTEVIPGPPGRDGFDGRDGVDGKDGEEAYTFEYELTFNRDTYRELLLFPDDFQMIESDVVMTYFLWEVDDDGNEIWRPAPQQIFTADGPLVYNTDFTMFDVTVFLEAPFNLDLLGASYLENWVVRTVVIPANFRGRIDLSDYNAIKEQFKLEDTKLASRGYKKTF